MWLYFGREYTSAESGSAIRDVTCEKCGCAYHYELARTGVGQASSPYYLNNRGAAARAQRRAGEHLRKLLATDLEAVPCPDCGWVQADMVRWLQRDHLRWLSRWSMVVGAVVLLVLCVWFLIAWQDRSADPRVMREIAGWMIVTIAAVGALVGLRRMLASRRDPNDAFPRRPQVRPGTPPALVRIESDDPSVPVRYVPAREEELTAMAGDWAEVQMQRAVLPDLCCACLGHRDRTYRVPFYLSERSSMPVPLCGPCHRRILWRWWGWVAISLLLAAVVGAGVGVSLTGTDDVGRAILGGIVFVLAAAVLPAILPEWRVRPYRMKTLDATRGVARVRFTNPRYTELFAALYVEGATLESQPTAPPPPSPPRAVGAKM